MVPIYVQKTIGQQPGNKSEAYNKNTHETVYTVDGKNKSPPLKEINKENKAIFSKFSNFEFLKFRRLDAKFPYF